MNLFLSYRLGELVLEEQIIVGGGEADVLTVGEYFQNEESTKTIPQILNQLDEISEFKQRDGGVVTITVTSSNDTVAAGLANAYVNAFFKYEEEDQKQKTRRELEYFDVRFQEVEQDLRNLEDSLFTSELEFLSLHLSDIAREVETLGTSLYTKELEFLDRNSRNLELEISDLAETLYAEELAFVELHIGKMGKEVRAAKDSLYEFIRGHSQLPEEKLGFDKLAREVVWLQELLDLRTEKYRSLLSQRDEVRLKQAHLWIPESRSFAEGRRRAINPEVGNESFLPELGNELSLLKTRLNARNALFRMISSQKELVQRHERHLSISEDLLNYDQAAQDLLRQQKHLDARDSLYQSLFSQLEQVRLRQRHLVIPKDVLQGKWLRDISWLKQVENDRINERRKLLSQREQIRFRSANVEIGIEVLNFAATENVETTTWRLGTQIGVSAGAGLVGLIFVAFILEFVTGLNSLAGWSRYLTSSGVMPYSVGYSEKSRLQLQQFGQMR